MQQYCILLICTLSYLIFTINCEINICLPLSTTTYEQDKLNDALLYEQITNDIREAIIKNDTIHIDHIDVNITHPAFRLNGTLDNLTISNLDDHTLRLFIFNDVDMDLFNLTLNNLSIVGQYDWTGNIGDLFDIYGKGDFWMIMNNFSIAMTHFNLSIIDELCLTINIDLTLGQVHNHFDNFMNGEELEDLLNRVFEAIIPESLEIIWEEIKDNIDGPLENMINDWLHKKHVREFLQRKMLSSNDFIYLN